MTKNDLYMLLKDRFDKHKNRHPKMLFEDVMALVSKEQFKTISMMEETGGAPDFVLIDQTLYVIDMAKETPKNRVSLCYDQQARETRKKFPPLSSATEMAKDINIFLLDEDLYKKIQHIEPLDLKTSSWLLTPKHIRDLGGALFGDRRYDHVFVYHNGADSYYGSRGFRGYIIIKKDVL